MSPQRRKNELGWVGFDDQGRQQCRRCWAWQFPVIHSCPGVPQIGRTAPPAPTRIQLRRTKGWRLPPNAVSVARPGKLGNPFNMMDVAVAYPSLTQHQIACSVVNQFRGERHLRGYPSDDEIRAELAGRDPACWCRLDQLCHADVLLEIANGGNR